MKESKLIEMQKQLETLGEKISDSDKEDIEKVIAEVKSNVESDNIEELKTSLKTLEEKLAVFLNQDSPESEASESNTEDDGIVDSEIKDV